MNRDIAFGSLQKPTRGAALLDAKERRADRRDAEQAVMQAALKRDGRKCRFPGCTGKYRGLELPIDACHQVHRGIGGDKSGTRTTRATVIALCRKHHGEWDSGLIDIEPLSSDGFDGSAAFYVKHPITGVMEHKYSETAIGVSVAVGE